MATEEGAEKREPENSTWAVLGVAAGGIAWLLFLSGLFLNEAAFVASSLLGAVAATVLGLVAHNEIAKSAGRVSGRGLALAAIVLGLVHIGGWFLLPFLALLFCWPASWSAAPTCTWNGSPGSPPSDPCCCDGSCDDSCDCGACSCASAACGCCECADSGCCECADCGCCECADCACGGGCCAVLAPRVDVPRKGGTRASWRDALAHHPDHAAFDADVYRVAGARLCIGCFTTFPVFFLATAALLAAPPAAPWWALALVGGGLALAQVVSSLGFARTRWMKAGVKTALGVGMALLVRGVLDSPLAPLQQAGVLLALLGLSALSALPRRARIKKALHALRD